MLATLALSLIVAADQGEGIMNGGFEERGTRDDPIPTWTISIGARNGGTEPLSEISIDRRVRHSGRSSLHFSASRTTYAFQIVSQDVEARPGGVYRLTGFARTNNVRHEVNAKGINQFNNCYLAIFFFDGNGELVARDVRTPTQPNTDDWQGLSLRVDAPDSVRRVEVKMFLSISGDLWFDDLELAIEGGREIPAPASVFRDGFEGLRDLPATWLVEEGARNGGTSPVSTVEVARSKGAGRSRGSLHLAGDKRTLFWQSANRYFEATPADVFLFSALVSAQNVRREENVRGVQQFANFHLRLLFFDEEGNTLGAPRFAQPGFGDYEWKEALVRAVAPEGTTRGMAGIFLSVSGDVWVDDVELTRQLGGIPAYDGWKTLETEHLTIRFPADHPLANEMDRYGARLEEALTHIASELDSEVEEPITVFLYRDGAQGEALTGRPLAYAEPERRAVHQDATHTLGHELAHVVALGLGYAHSGLFGEGLAVWLNGAPPEAHHQRAAAMLESGELPTMEALLTDFRGQDQGYPAAGSFCGWFLETHGLDALRRLYPKKDLDAAADAVLGKSMGELDTEWRSFLKKRG